MLDRSPHRASGSIPSHSVSASLYAPGVYATSAGGAYSTIMFRTNRILVAIDFSDGSGKALALAHRLSEESHGTLHLVHVKVLYGEEDDGGDESAETLQASMEKLYSRVCEEHGLPTDRAVEFTALRDVAPAAALLRYAADKHCDLIVSGTHGRRGFRRMILGSVAEELVRLAPCPVLTVSEKLTRIGEVRSILVPVDFSLYSKSSLAVARELAGIYGSTIQLLHVVEEAMHPAFYNAGVFSVYDMDPEIEQKALKELAGRPYRHPTKPQEWVTFETANEDLAFLNGALGVALGELNGPALSLTVYLVRS